MEAEPLELDDPFSFLSVCSGIEAASVAWEALGWQPLAFSEIEPFPSAVLAHHWPDVPNLGDMTKYHDWPEYRPNLIVGGTPCQAFSVAGLREGLADPRGNLTLTFLGVVAKYRPRWVVWENVPGVLSDRTNAFGHLLAGLAELGYGWAYRVLDAQHFGVPQRRRRVFVVGCLGDWTRAAAVLFEPESLSGNTAKKRKKREAASVEAGAGVDGDCGAGRTGDGRHAGEGTGIAPTIPVRTTAGGGLGTDFDLDGGVIPIQEIGKRQSGTPMNGVGHGKPGDPMFTLQRRAVHGLAYAPEIAPSRTARDGKGERQDVGEPSIIAYDDRNQAVSEGVHHTLRGNAVGPRVSDAIAFQPGNLSRGAGAEPSEDVFPTIKADHGRTFSDQSPHVATLAIRGRADGCNLEYREDGTSNAILTPSGGRAGIGVGAIHQGIAVRRLTPRECERLQGFPDDHTLIPWRKKPAEECPDGPRYKAIGNSMAVPVMRWIGVRIAAQERATP